MKTPAIERECIGEFFNVIIHQKHSGEQRDTLPRKNQVFLGAGMEGEPEVGLLEQVAQVTTPAPRPPKLQPPPAPPRFSQHPAREARRPKNRRFWM